MLNHILIPLDGSPLAEAAIEVANRVILAGAKITLLTVVQQPSVPVYGYDLAVALTPSYPSKVEDAISEAKSYLQKIGRNLRTQGFQVNLIAEFADDPAHVIVEKARRIQVDAIVMSTHGRSGISRWLFGSVAEKVLSTANCPVLVTPSREKERILTEQASENYVG